MFPTSAMGTAAYEAYSAQMSSDIMGFMAGRNKKLLWPHCHQDLAHEERRMKSWEKKIELRVAYFHNILETLN